MAEAEGSTSAPPQEDKKAEHITIKVVSQGAAGSSEVFFKIKKSTPLRKLMDAYCEKQGKQAGSLRFMFEGNRIAPTSTPDSLGMENEDLIEAFTEQYGGVF